MEISDDVERIAAAARAFAEPGEELSAVIPAEPAAGVRVYLCAYGNGPPASWLALDDAGKPVRDRALIRDAVSIAAMCEIAEETAGGGDLAALRAELRSLSLRESPIGIEEAEEAALALERTLEVSLRVASPRYLDELGAATRRLEQALGEVGRSPFAEAMKHALGPVEELKLAVESGYKGGLA